MKLEKLDGKTFDEVSEFLETNRHVLVLEGDRELEVAKVADKDGCEAGAAVAVAFRFLEENGAPALMYKAIEMYESFDSNPSFILKKLRMGVAWVTRPYLRTAKWPIEPYSGDDMDKHGGLANVMLAVAERRLAAGSNTEIMAAIAIREFIEEGIAKKERTMTERSCHE